MSKSSLGTPPNACKLVYWGLLKEIQNNFKGFNTTIENGKIELNGNRIKASKEIAKGDLLSVRRGDTVQVVTVLALTDKRGSATFAQGLYEETEQSILERAIVTEKKKIIRAGYSSPKSKPSKKDRRKIAELQMNGDTYN